MPNVWNCYGVETTVDGVIDVLVDGEIEEVFDGFDSAGFPKYVPVVCATAIYPVVMKDGREEYSDYPLSFIPLSWKRDLIDAVRDEAQAEAEHNAELAYDRR